MSCLAFWCLFLGRFIWFCKSGVAKHIKKKHCLGNSYVEKSIIFGFLTINWTSCTYFNHCVLRDFNWAGPIGWAKTRSKTSQNKNHWTSCTHLAMFVNIFVNVLTVIDTSITKEKKKRDLQTRRGLFWGP